MDKAFTMLTKIYSLSRNHLDIAIAKDFVLDIKSILKRMVCSCSNRQCMEKNEKILKWIQYNMPEANN